MFQGNSIVTLAIDKEHPDGEDILRLKAGVCGMIVKTERRADNNHLYAVDFGAYGQWYCYHNELSGDDREGWDQVQSTLDPLREREENLEGRGLSGVSGPIESLSDDNDEPLLPPIDLEKDIQRRMNELKEARF